MGKYGSVHARLAAIGLTGMLLVTSCFNPFGLNHRIYGSGNLVQETRDIQSFTSVVLTEEGDLFIDVGEHEQLIVEAEDNLQDYLVTETDNSVLEIKKLPEQVTLRPTEPIRYFLTVRALTSLTVKNSGDVEVTKVETDHFQVRITSSGSVHIGTLNVNRLDIELTSSGNLTIGEGIAGEQHINVSSSGEYDGKSIVCERAYVRLSSSGNAIINVSELIEADLSSSGNVYYAGDPRIVYTDSSSSGRVYPLH